MTRSRAHGFTLLEVIIATAVGLVVVLTAMTFVVSTDRAHARRVRYAQLRRTAARVLDQLGAELRQAGHGVPTGSGLEGSHAAFPSRTLVLGTATSIGFLADLPRPDGSLDGYSTLADDQVTGMPSAGVALLNALNGDCDVSLGSVHCQTRQTTRLFPRTAGGCHLSASDATCPWGLNRYRANETVWVVNAAGQWVERQVAAGVSASSATRRTLQLDTALPSSLTSRAREGFLTSLDRVFFRDNGSGVLERHQCWGSVGTPTLASLGPCPMGAGTPWEALSPLPTGSTLTFSYFDANGAALATPVSASALPLVARVDIALHLERQGADETLTYDSNLSVGLRQ